VTVNFVSPDGLTQRVKVNRPRCMQMNRVFDAYAQRTSMDHAWLRFVHAGRFVRYCETLEELGLHDGDQIHALRFRAGLKAKDLATAGRWQACSADEVVQKGAADVGS
jgi:hypothetical protein